MLILIIAHNLNLSRKCDNWFVFTSRAMILLDIFWLFPHFKSILYIKQSDIKNFKFLFLVHGLSFDILEQKENIGGHQTNYLSGGPNSTQPPQISRRIQYKT